MEKHTNKEKISLFKNDKITLVRSNGDKMPGKVTELTDMTFWVKYRNPDRWAPDSKIGDTVNMLLHYESFELPFSAKVIQRYNPGEIAVDVCYEAGDDVSLVRRHEQLRSNTRFPVYIKKILNVNDHTDYVTKPGRIPKEVYGSGQSAFLPCKSMDISGGGIRIQTERVFEKGNLVECIFQIGGSTLAVVAAIATRKQRRSGIFEYGLKFEKIHPDNARKIIKFVYSK